jgi:hypothetical protein
MIIAGFTIMGIIVGILATLAYVLHLADRKAETEAPPQGIAAVGLDMHGRGTSIESVARQTSIPSDALERVFRQLEIGRG